ncbi:MULTISPECIES: class I SAM-dependent methyltransferase [unclassified Butyrivibrio]|uniref:class I SAM-dependent methyltransferase n=1 Tax=unclassified Butyrivibrio TaxID=2639466 RepID=UPI0003B671BC|nr:MULTISPECIES: class I SAM-dependent methyltransferase [unclassified Butyrivibrio]MDC7293779.1 class I SAM-dependent methyltransferase [Butyrivibrio sp. DSM 10294]
MMKIGSSNDSAAVKEQYATSKGLDTRLNFHDKYSTNKLGYGNWTVSNYEINEGMKVLELGCGTGSIWLGRDELLSRFGKLVMTDLSEGMLATAKENLGERENIEYRLADIQNLPFEDNSFDMVIANSMLYHVPDINKGISEVRRVLRADGAFYTTTLGENNFTDKLAEWFELGGESFKPNHNFTMQNGEGILRSAFEEVETRIYEDSLHITDIDDLVGYLCSLASFKAILDVPVNKITEILKGHAINGTIDLPKEYGMLIAKGTKH